MDAQECGAAAGSGPPAYDSVAAWWDMVRRNLQSFPNSCSALGRKIAAMYDSFTSKSLKEHIFPPLMEMLIYFNFYKAPFLVDLKKPEVKVPHTVNFYVKPKPGVMLGVWHTVPSCRGEEAKGKGVCWYEAALQDGNPIIVYLHGSAQHRGAPHRCKLAKELDHELERIGMSDYVFIFISPYLQYIMLTFPVRVGAREWIKKVWCLHTVEYHCAMKKDAFASSVLSDGGFHVLSVDYRGFGDSTGKPTEQGLTEDSICVYEWAKARSGRTPVCLWGHSLGTGVATNAARILEERGCPVDAIVLECPYSNIWVASISYPLLQICQKFPRCLQTLTESLKEDRIVFANDENVKFLSSPLLIIHGEDDRTVPIEDGEKLYEIARAAYRNKERVEMVIFPPGFHHNYLCKSPMFVKVVRDFLSKQWA